MADNVTGDREARRRLRRLARTAPLAVLKGLYEEAAIIFARSQEMVPVDTGRLMQSGVMGVTSNAIAGPQVSIGYGTNYAVPVHERTELDEGRRARGSDRRSKYLEIPFDEQLPGMLSRVAARTEQRLEVGASNSELPDKRGTRGPSAPEMPDRDR